MNIKYNLEEDNIKYYQEIQELKRKRLKNIVEIDRLENFVRKKLDRKEIKRSEIR